MTNIQLRALERAVQLIANYDSFNIRRALDAQLTEQNVEPPVAKAVVATFDAYAQKEYEKLREAKIWIDDLIKDAKAEK